VKLDQVPVGWEVPTSEAWCSSTVATRVRFAPSGRIHRDSGLSGWCQWWGVLSRCPRQPTCRTGTKLRGTCLLQVASDCHWFHVNQRSKQGRVYHASACLDSLSVFVKRLCVGFTWKAMKAKQSKACKYAGWATQTVGCHVERSAALQVTRAPGRTTERGTCWTEAVLEGVHSLAATV
jgi:hypothetical protein